MIYTMAFNIVIRATFELLSETTYISLQVYSLRNNIHV